MCLHIKRFRHDGFFSNKISTYVEFPLTGFDMSPYYTKLNEQDSEETYYYLFALIAHYGSLNGNTRKTFFLSSLSYKCWCLFYFLGGHYVCYARHSMNHEWYEFNDKEVIRKTESEISKIEAYVLFYQREISHQQYTERYHMISRVQSMEIHDLEISCLISRLWFMEWLYCNSPGPLSFIHCICEHGHINKVKYPHYRDYIIRIPKFMYEELKAKYGFEVNSMIEKMTKCLKCEIYEKSLQIRRKLEEKEVSILDSLTIPKGHYWHLIHSEWLKLWHNFKQGDDVPGLISNHLLLDQDSKPLKGLRKAVDYRGVNRRVWNYFYERYGGGPVIIRHCIDIYSPEIMSYNSKPTSEFNTIEEMTSEDNDEIDSSNSSVLVQKKNDLGSII